jgi:hypothetical protein
MNPSGKGPGLARTKRAQLFHSRTLRLVAASDARWGELFDTADVMSEGAPRGEGSERAYFGSSNIILLIAPEGPYQSAHNLAGAVARDPHVRLRAMRVARREAGQRANAPLDRVRTEISVSLCATGVAVHVDVEALVLPDRRVRPRAAIAKAACSPGEAVASLNTLSPTTAIALPAANPSANLPSRGPV